MTKKVYRLVLVLCALIDSCNHQDEFDGKNGTRIAYVEGTKNILQSVEYKNGKKNGIMLNNYNNGKPHYKANYVNDKLQDSAFYYFDNGQISSAMIYSDGKKTGCWKKYSSKGILYQEMNFVNDHLDGTSIKYSFGSATIIEKLHYKEGLKDGKQEYFYDNGKPKCIAYYSHNNPCLGLQEWTKKGEKINNDFKINITDQNRVHLENKLKIIVRLEHPQNSDAVSEVSTLDKGNIVTTQMYLIKKGDQFETWYNIMKGDMVMSKIKIAAFRKTSMGNTMIKTSTYNVSANNF